MTDLLTAKEVSAALRLSIHTIRSWTFRGRLPVVKLGRRCLYRRADLEYLVERNRRPSQEKENEGGKQRE